MEKCEIAEYEQGIMGISEDAKREMPRNTRKGI